MLKKYKIVTTIKEIASYCGSSTTIAVDFETAPDANYRSDSKAALDPHKSHIVTVSLSVAEGSAIMIPVAHLNGGNIDSGSFWTWFRSFLEDKNIKKVIHNAAFESMFAYKNGIIIRNVYDTICAAQMTLVSNFQFRKLQSSGLKELASEFFGESFPSFAETTKGHFFDELDPNATDTICYSCADADIALRLYYLFNKWFDSYMPRHRWIVENLESPTAVYIGIMQYHGVPINVQLLFQKTQETEAKILRLKTEIAQYTGSINLGANCSTAAFKNFLFNSLNLPVLKCTEKGLPSIDDESIQLLTDWCASNRSELVDFFHKIQEYRRLNKLLSTYLVGYQKHINSATNRIHPHMFALSTETGRFNCQAPNLQNMPRQTNDPVGIRSIISAPEGYSLISCDYSQIELRVGAFYCRDDKMLETYRTGGDIHASTTSVIYGCDYATAADKSRPDYKENRSLAKNVNFGVFYGLFPKGLQKTLKTKANLEKTEQECREIINNLKRGYPRLSQWQRDTIAQAKSYVYIETFLGRRRYLPDIASELWSNPSRAERCALNTPIQGTAADIMKIAITRILSALVDHPWLQPILQIHDELVFLVPDARVDEGIQIVRNIMELPPFPEFDLPLVAEAVAGKSFGHMD